MLRLLLPFLLLSCQLNNTHNPDSTIVVEKSPSTADSPAPYDADTKTVHVLVALCDNKYQGIVPVPAKMGNGQDPDNNLYWGCAYGIRSYFKNSKNWQFIKRYAIDSIKMERLIFKHRQSHFYLVADAYNGKYIKECTIDFFNSCAGKIKDTVRAGNKTVGINGNAKLVAYIGHDGLMDFSL